MARILDEQSLYLFDELGDYILDELDDIGSFTPGVSNVVVQNKEDDIVIRKVADIDLTMVD